MRTCIQWLVCLGALSLVVTGCGAPASPVPSPQPSGPVRPTGPYLGQTPPDTTPTIFAPGVVSDPSYTEYSGTFSPGGDEYYFNRFSDTSPSELLFSQMVQGTWTDPKPVAVTAGYAAAEPLVTFDNQRLFFMWERPVPEGQPSYLGGGGYYVAQRTAGGWSEPTYAGQGMFLSSTRAGSLFTTDMSSRQADGTTYLAQVATDQDGLFTRYDRITIGSLHGSPAHPCISPDGRYLLFDVDSGSHLFVSFRQANGSWSQAIDLATHGLDPLAGGATVSPDGKYLFFSLREDIWWVSSAVIEALEPNA